MNYYINLQLKISIRKLLFLIPIVPAFSRPASGVIVKKMKKSFIHETGRTVHFIKIISGELSLHHVL